MKRKSGFGVHNTKRNAFFAGFLRRGLSGFLAASTAVMMLSGSVASLYAEESTTEYALAGAGSGQDVTVHFGDDENQDISIHINAETDEDATLAGLGSELTDETESESTGLKEVEAGDLVTISPVDGSDLPEEAEAGAAIVEGEEAIAAVETKVEEEGTAEAATESSADTGSSAASQAAGNVGIANTQYQVFDISLDHVDTEQYEDGFKVAVNLPDNIKGARDFHLYHLHEGEEPKEIELTTVESVDKKTGLEVVSGFEFVTEGFSEFVLKYTVDFYYDVDGKTLEYHIVGGSVQSLRDLLQILNIAADNPATEDDDLSVFMNNIENVTFSDESLVKPVCVSENTTAGAVIDALGKEVEYSAELTKDNIAQIRAMRLTAPDWALVSLKPFLSEETLTIVMKNGDVVTIKVTDAQDAGVFVGKQVIIYDNGEQRAMTADWDSNKYRTQFNSVALNGADSNEKARWTVEYNNGSYYLKAYNGKYLWLDNNNVSLVVSQSAATPLTIQAGNNPDYRIYDKNIYNNVLTYCKNGNYEGFFSAPGGTYGEADNYNQRWLYIKEANVPSQVNKFSVDVATWTSYGNRWGQLNSKYFGLDSAGNGINGNRYPTNGVANGNYDNNKGYTRFNVGVNPVPYDGYAFAFWAYQHDGLYRELSKINNETKIPYNPTEYYAYYTPKGKKLFLYQSEDTNKGTVRKSYGYSDQEGATATPQGGYQFIGWFNESGNLVSLESTFPAASASKSMVLTARFIYPRQVTIHISADDPNGGDVVAIENGREVSYLGDRQTNSSGMLATTITAKPKEGYTFCYWALNGDRLLDSDVLSNNSSIGPTPYFQAGDQLQAVFKKSHTIDADGNAHSTIEVGTEKKEEFERWLKSLQEGKPLSADKTAKVHDYNNRIYQVDIDAESARVNASGKIGLAFILDASNSMQFPASVERTGKTLVLTQNNLNKAFPNETGPLYFISDPTQTSTMYRLYKEDGYWYAVDASYSDANKIKEKRYLVDWNYFYSDAANKGNVPLAYPIYRDTSNWKRKDYLNQGLQDTINTMRNIVTKVNQENYDIMVADTMFAAYTLKNHGDDTAPPAGFKWEDFRSLKQDFTVDLGDTDGGTRQDLGLQDALGFNWDSIPQGQRYAILITDGAAVIGGKGTTWDGKNYQGVQDNIVAQANALKNLGVKLITVGLSTKNVVGGSNVMKDIASDNLFFEAESGEDLQNILYEIVQTVVKNGTSCGSITDEVDEAFYPVKADGTPIPRGTSYYKADGTRIEKEDYDRLGPWNSRYKWEETDGKWKITWENQYIGWNPTDSDPRKQPWKGTFYVKAKENFLGGNTISTNDSCTVVEDGYTFDETLTQNVENWTLHDSASKPRITLDTPYVNVDELALTQNSTEWTVYLGTSVDPLTQLKDLYSKIDVLKVVSENTGNTDEMITSNEQMLGDKINGRSETFKLGSIVSGLATLNDVEWSSLINNGTVTKPYSHYSHDNVGNIQIKLTKQETVSGEPGLNPSPHNTAVVEEGVEKYTFTVTYVPKAESTPLGGWHTTPGGSRGEETGNMESTNNHKINVFDRKISVEKTDTEGNKITDYAAKFKLYRRLDTGENDTSSEALTVNNDKASVVQVGNEIVTTNGVADLPRLPVGGTYYLVETEAPQGFAKLETPIAIQMDLTNRYWSWNVQETSAGDTLQDALKPYNWRQAVTITCNDTGWNGNKYQLSVKNQRSVNIRIEKIDESKRSAGRTPLTGAMFKLMKWDGDVPASGAEVGYTKFNDAYSTGSGAPVDAQGVLQFKGLPDGEYEIVETQAPAGFIKVDNVIYFRLQGGVVYRHSAPTSTGSQINWGTDIDVGNGNEVDCVTYTRATNNSEATFVIGNTPGSVLPATGGEGTRMIYLLGIALMALAGAGLVLTRREKERAV